MVPWRQGWAVQWLLLAASLVLPAAAFSVAASQEADDPVDLYDPLAPSRASLTIDVYEDMAFGHLISGRGGIVRLDPRGRRDLIQVHALPGDQFNTARLVVQGEPHEEILLEFYAPRARGGRVWIREFMTIPEEPFRLDAAGRLEVTVGADLVIAPHYSGEAELPFEVEVHYLWEDDPFGQDGGAPADE